MAPSSLVVREPYAPPVLSTGAIIGIAIGGAVIIFAALAPLLIYIAHRQDRQYAATAGPVTTSSLRPQSGSPRRLRKKGIIDNSLFEAEATSSLQNSSLPVLPPVFSRPSSFTLGPFDEDGSSKEGGRHSADARLQRPKSRSPEKQRGYGVYENRRKTSWIDEDALHGPRIVTPGKTKRKASWLGKGLGRSLSRSLSFRKRAAELMGSPTLPCTDVGPRQGFGTPNEGNSNARGPAGDTTHGMHELERPMAPRPALQQAAASPRKAYIHVSTPDSCHSPGFVSRPPSNVIHNPRHRNNLALEAAQQLAGGARVPDSFTVKAPQTPGQTRRPSRMRQNATETDLTEILRMTAERLQDGNRSARRQTMMIPGSGGSKEGDYLSLRCEPSYSGISSPAKSQKSAPAAIGYSELEGCSPATQHFPPQTHTPRHTRQISHVSMMSMMSEPDSLVASWRGSQAEVQTALSSPSRAVRTRDPVPTPSPQGGNLQQSRPYSTASSESSALSTLYSEEASTRSPPISELRLEHRSPTDTERRAITQALSAYDIFNNNNRHHPPSPDNQPQPQHEKHPLENDDRSPRPLRLRKGTLGEIVGPLAPRALPAPPPDREPPKTRLSFTIHALDQPHHDNNKNDDPFVVATPSPPPRLSRLFSPLPAELPGGTEAQATTMPLAHVSDKTPTPSPSRRRVVPPPQTLRAAASSPTLGAEGGESIERGPSPAVSEAGLSSVYDSYSYSYRGGDARTEETDSTATLVTVPSMTTSPARPPRIPESGRESRMGFRDDAEQHSVRDDGGGGGFRTSEAKPASPSHHKAHEPPRFTRHVYAPSPQRAPSHRSAVSDGSVYSQDELAPLANTHLTMTVAELRRMNSQVSCVSGYSNTTTTAAGPGAAESPTLPALRGGGFSPGKKGGGGRNYLSLGTPPRDSPRRRDGEEAGNLVGSRSDAVVAGQSRRGTVVGPLQEDSSGGNVGTAPDGRVLVTHAVRLVREEEAIKRASVESLGLYDEKGFLRSSPVGRRRDSTSPLSRRV